jgi:hypothetical protein
LTERAVKLRMAYRIPFTLTKDTAAGVPPLPAARERLGSEYEPQHRAGDGLTLDEAVAEARLHLQD